MADKGSRWDGVRAKQNFRYDVTRWGKAQDKTVRMRRAGYDVDMTKVLTAATDQFVDETDEQTVVRLGLARQDQPVGIYRRPAARES